MLNSYKELFVFLLVRCTLFIPISLSKKWYNLNFIIKILPVYSDNRTCSYTSCTSASWSQGLLFTFSGKFTKRLPVLNTICLKNVEGGGFAQNLCAFFKTYFRKNLLVKSKKVYLKPLFWSNHLISKLQPEMKTHLWHHLLLLPGFAHTHVWKAWALLTQKWSGKCKIFTAFVCLWTNLSFILINRILGISSVKQLCKAKSIGWDKGLFDSAPFSRWWSLAPIWIGGPKDANNP